MINCISNSPVVVFSHDFDYLVDGTGTAVLQVNFTNNGEYLVALISKRRKHLKQIVILKKI